MKIPMAIMLTPTLVLLVLIPLCLFINNSPLQLQQTKLRGSDQAVKLQKGCDLFKGTWVSQSNGTYYSNETCPLIIDQQNCLKFGKPETDFLNWRWKPDQCELPRFDAAEFLEIVRGKSVAFVGDSVGKNQMQSLLCLLYGVSVFWLSFSACFWFEKCPGLPIRYLGEWITREKPRVDLTIFFRGK